MKILKLILAVGAYCNTPLLMGNVNLLVMVLILSLACMEAGAEAVPPKERTIRKGERKKPSTDQDKGGVKMTKASYELLGLQTIKVEKRSLGKQLKVTAEIQLNANRVFHIGPRVPGRVVDVFADLGDEVQKGQKLALLDSIELGQAISEYLSSKTKLEVRKANFER